jgi:hypothetical protein
MNPLAWRKSSWTSDGTQGNCVEVAELPNVGEPDGRAADGRVGASLAVQ